MSCPRGYPTPRSGRRLALSALSSSGSAQTAKWTAYGATQPNLVRSTRCLLMHVRPFRWYTDFERCEDVLWERYFRCDNLGRDLVPVVQAFKASQECSTNVPSAESICASPPLQQDVATDVPAPIDLSQWVSDHSARLEAGEEIDLMASLSHPDPEFSILAAGHGTQQVEAASYCETWVYQLRGKAVVRSGAEPGKESELGEGCCCLIAPGESAQVEREEGSVGIVVRQRPGGKDCAGG